MRCVLAPVVVCAACIPAPDPIRVTGTDPGGYFDTYDDPPPTSGWSTGSGETSDAGNSVTADASASADPMTTDDPPATSTSGEPPGTGDAGGSTTGWPPGFPPPEPFGDDASETELVGQWTSPWNPAGSADISIAVTADGAFTWTETSADCAQTLVASGLLWVEGPQLVMHVEAWDKADPWPVDHIFDLEAPFRLRLGYSVLDGVMGMSAPWTVTEVRPWAGRGYERVGMGAGAQGVWTADSELWALIDVEPTLIVRDRIGATLVGGGAVTLSTVRTWFYPQEVANPPIEQPGVWSEGAPGNVTVRGVPHVYDATRMLSNAQAQSFRFGVTSDCR